MWSDRPIWGLAVAQTIVWSGLFYLFPALLPRWESDLGWSKTDLTGAMTAALAVSALVSPVAGWLIDRGRGPAVLAGSAALGGVFVGLLSLVETSWQFYGLWVLIGAAMGGGLYEPCFAQVTRSRGAEARPAITRITLVAGFAGTLSFPVAHGVSEALGWRAAVMVFAALICCVAVPLAWRSARRLESARVPLPPPQAGARSESSLTFLARPEFWLLAAAFSLVGMNHGVILSHLLPLLAERGTSADTAVLAAAMIGPMQVAGRLAILATERHVSSLAVTVACFVGVSAATLCLLGAAAVPALLIAFVILQGSGYGVVSIMKPVVVRVILGQRNFGSMAGALAVPYLAAFAVAPLLGSLLWEVGGYALVLQIVLALALAGLAAYLVAVRVNRHRSLPRPRGR